MKKIKNFLQKVIWSFSTEGIEAQRIEMIRRKCNHEHWECDSQIRIIRCKSCGLMASIDNYVDLFKKKDDK
jgi:hypothetical protein